MTRRWTYYTLWPRHYQKRTDIFFLLGLAAIEKSGQPDITESDREALLADAIKALRTILIDRPDLVRVRLELARAFYLNGDDGLARDHFERVLAGNPPPSGRCQCSAFP